MSSCRATNAKAYEVHLPPKCPWRIGMRAVVTSTTVLREWRDRVGIVKGIQEHEIKLELDGDGRPEVWFYKRDVAPLRRNVGRL